MSDAMEFIVPDRIGDIHAWRLWHVVYDSTANKLLLGSVNHPHLWAPKEILTAVCAHGTLKEHHDADIPHEKCSCGVYAAKDIAGALTYDRAIRVGTAYLTYNDDGTLKGNDHLTTQALIVGTIQMWGKVEEGSNAYRSRFAYPSKLLIPSFKENGILFGDLAQEYGVMTERGDAVDAMYHLVKRRLTDYVSDPKLRTVTTSGRNYSATITDQQWASRKPITNAGPGYKWTAINNSSIRWVDDENKK